MELCHERQTDHPELTARDKALFTKQKRDTGPSWVHLASQAGLAVFAYN